jgi:hypothetical protein
MERITYSLRRESETFSPQRNRTEEQTTKPAYFQKRNKFCRLFKEKRRCLRPPAKAEKAPVLSLGVKAFSSIRMKANPVTHPFGGSWRRKFLSQSS